MTKSLLTFGIGIFLGVQANALEPKDPVSFCERFLPGEAQTECETRVKKLSPDWYLASVCNLNFEDHLFYRCLDLSKTGSYSPKALESCTGEEMSDSERIACVLTAKSSLKESFQQRAPAAQTKKSKKK